MSRFLSKIPFEIVIIGHVLKEQGTEYEHIFSLCEYSISIELKMGTSSERAPKISKFTKFDCYWFKREGIVHF